MPTEKDPALRPTKEVKIALTLTDWTALQHAAHNAGYAQVTPYLRYILRTLAKGGRLIQPNK